MEVSQTVLTLSELEDISTSSKLIENCGSYLKMNKVQRFSIKNIKTGNLVGIQSGNRITSTPYRVSFISRQFNENPKLDWKKEETTFKIFIYPPINQADPILINGKESYMKGKKDEFSRVINKSYKIKESVREEEVVKTLKKDSLEKSRSIFKSKVGSVCKLYLIPDRTIAKTHPTKDTIHYKI